MVAIYKHWAPQCAVPDCIELVGYHNKGDNNSYKFKMCCETHRTSKKHIVDNWKLKQGCNNVDARYGFKCTSNITHPSQLDVNHIDGNRYNNSKENLEILCKVCHSRVTVDSKHHTTRYCNEIKLDPALFEIVE